MVDLLRSSSPEPRGARARRQQMETEEAKLASRLGRAPSSTELAESLGLTTAEFHRNRYELAGVQIGSIEECYADTDGAFGSNEPDAETILLQREDGERLTQAISSLSERHQLVIQLYFVEELNLAEIAAVLGVSVPRIHQLKAAALEKVQSHLSG
jgi:RNA polymerase sigma factor for flagellar operon FliA